MFCRTRPRFDEHGIWRYDGISFSRCGNLTRTVIKLVEDSPEGLEAQKLCTILGVTAASLYTHFRGIKKIRPKRFGRTLVYFSAKQDIYKRQTVLRNQTTAKADAMVYVELHISRSDGSDALPYWEYAVSLPPENPSGCKNLEISGYSGLELFIPHFGIGLAFGLPCPVNDLAVRRKSDDSGQTEWRAGDILNQPLNAFAVVCLKSYAIVDTEP